MLKFKQVSNILKEVTFIKIAAILIVAILSCIVSASGVMIAVSILAVLLFVAEIIFCKKLVSAKDEAFSFFSYVPSLALFICFLIYNILIGQNLYLSIILSLISAMFLLPQSSILINALTYYFNKDKYVYSKGFDSCKIFGKTDVISVDAELLYNKNLSVEAISTMYSYFDKNNIGESSDYAINILRDFSSLIYPDILDVKAFFATDCVKFRTLSSSKYNNITYSVIETKDGVRVVAAGNYEDIISLCSECADSDSLLRIEDAKEKIINSVDLLRNEKSDVICFAFTDIESFNNESDIKDLIFIGSVSTVKNVTATHLLKQITKLDYQVDIKVTDDNLEDVIKLLDSFSFEYSLCDDILTVNKKENPQSCVKYSENKLICDDDYVTTSDGVLNISDAIENAKIICSNTNNVCKNNGVLSVSVIMLFLLSNMLVLNNVLQPHIMLLIICAIELFSLVSYGISDLKQSQIKNVINAFVIAFSGLGLFFAGSYFIDGNTNLAIAQSMTVIFYVLLPVLLDSVFIFSNCKKHKNALIMIVAAIIVSFVINIPFIGGMFGLNYIPFGAYKYILLFVLIPVIVNTLLTSFISSKERKDNGE